MRYLFLVIGILLILASFVTFLTMPDTRDDVPVLYWTTDPNPLREKVVDEFKIWLDQTYGDQLESKYGFRTFDICIDAAKRDPSKIVIQGVSGVGGDFLNIRGGDTMEYLKAIGILEDITDSALVQGFSPEFTFHQLYSEITSDDKQYMFPSNVACRMLWINKDTFRKYNQPLPPSRWTFDEFEQMGLNYINAANSNGEIQKCYYLDGSSITPFRLILLRSSGLSVFNETLTKCDLNDSRYIEILNRLDKWINKLHLIPSVSEYNSSATESGVGGSTLRLFAEGKYAMFFTGRWGLIGAREIANFDLDAAEVPHAGFPNAYLTTLGVGIYKGSKYKDLAPYFLEFLAGTKYNMIVLECADGLPPTPKYLDTQEFRCPAQYKNEWPLHQAIAKAARSIGIPGVYSPFILPKLSNSIEQNCYLEFEAGLSTAEETAWKIESRINAEIQQTIEKNMLLKEDYQNLLKIQIQIDQLKKEGRKIPSEWIKNNFYKVYYEKLGMVE